MIASKTKNGKPPAYRLRPGYSQAIVTLTDSATGKRKDFWLGEYNTPESREMYGRVLSAWEANGRRFPAPANIPKPAKDELSINELILAYYRQIQGQYKPASLETIRMALRLLRQHYGSTAAMEFGPNRLRELRDQMIKGDSASDPPRKPWARSTVNKAVHQICAMFKWAASHEMLPVTVHQRLKTVAALRRGHSQARESDPVEPVAMEMVEAVRPFLSRQIKALVDLQLLTGARGGELFKLRPIDITMDDRKGIWTITPADHKTAHHGYARTIFLGPKAQAVIQPFLVGRPVNAYLFSPAEAEAERRAAAAARRKTPRSCGNGPGTNRVPQPKHKPGESYTSSSYRRAIERACDQAFPLPEPLARRLVPKDQRETVEAYRARLSSECLHKIEEWRRNHRWHPHQLRHAAATAIRREFGLEAARIALGHSSALITDAVYAERDMAHVQEVMLRIG